jgi:hypothetical protein
MRMSRSWLRVARGCPKRIRSGRHKAGGTAPRRRSRSARQEPRVRNTPPSRDSGNALTFLQRTDRRSLSLFPRGAPIVRVSQVLRTRSSGSCPATARVARARIQAMGHPFSDCDCPDKLVQRVLPMNLTGAGEEGDYQHGFTMTARSWPLPSDVSSEARRSDQAGGGGVRPIGRRREVEPAGTFLRGDAGGDLRPRERNSPKSGVSIPPAGWAKVSPNSVGTQKRSHGDEEVRCRANIRLRVIVSWSWRKSIYLHHIAKNRC